MIRIASFLVFFIGAAFAFGAFYLARGSQHDAPRAAVSPEPAPEIAVEATDTPAPPEVESLHYLRDIDFELGDITVIYAGFGPNGDAVIVRDQSALQAAKEQVYVNSPVAPTLDTGHLVYGAVGTLPDAPLIHIYRNDRLIAAISCINAACDRFAKDPNADHAGLLDFATPHQVFNDTFDDHETYLATILAISENPNFMLLDQRPSFDFPAPPISPTLTISLPTAVIQSIEGFDSAVFQALIRDAVSQQIPNGAQIENINMTELYPAYVADKDSGQFVTAGGQAIAFPDARFLPISVEISGIDRLSDAAYDAITAATLMEFDVDAQFSDFVTTRLQSSCVDCFFLKVNGPFYRSTRPTAQTIETYNLDYYDLREAP